MMKSIAHLGPSGTYTEAAAIAYANILKQETGEDYELCSYVSIAQTLYSTAEGKTDLAVVPVENSIQGTVAVTLDTIWELDTLQIHQGLILPISHQLLSKADSLTNIQTIYSHPQALAQCQKWLEKNLPHATLISTNSTTEAVQNLDKEKNAAAIASLRASKLYNMPILGAEINDYPDNCTRFWVVSLEKSGYGNNISLAFSFEKNLPGILVKPLEIFAQREINLTRIESRPTKRLLGEYCFFLDLEGDLRKTEMKMSVEELSSLTKTLKVFGNYDVLKIESSWLENL